MGSLHIDQDCKFYYSSSCSKRECPFRHEPAALKCYVTCLYWRKGKCHKLHCEYRHMELKREEIPCYWESQPEGCQKDDCPFLHCQPQRVAKSRPGRFRSAQNTNSRAQSVPRSPVSNVPTRREKVPSRGASARSVSQDNKTGEKKLRKKLQEMERKLQEEEQQNECIRGNKNGEKKLRKKLKEMEKKLQEKEQEKERVLRQHQEELDSHTSFTLQALQEELEASVNASTTCMTATEDIIRTVGSTMREEFECKICYELFITPMTLNCSHSFCEFCIKQWRVHSSNCPQCRQTITSQTRARAIENFIERMISNLTEDLKERRNDLIKARLISAN
ncbi:E3 ubiquitin-protein ligase rnf8 isoform X2 [Anabrus simplex]